MSDENSKTLSPTKQWMQNHPSDKPCPRTPLAANAWRRKRGIKATPTTTGHNGHNEGEKTMMDIGPTPEFREACRLVLGGDDPATVIGARQAANQRPWESVLRVHEEILELANYHRVLEEALGDPRYKWHTPLGDLVQDDVCSALRNDDLDHAKAAVTRVTQYQKAVGHPDGGFLALGATHINGGVISPHHLT